MSQAPNRHQRAFLVCFLAVWLGLLAFGRERMLRDPGTFWHTVVGDRILDSDSVPTRDAFSFTCEGHPWIAQQWLGEVLMACAGRVAGLDGLLMLSCAIIALIFAGLTGRLRDRGLRIDAAAVLITLTLAASSFHFFPRPHLATLVGIYLCYSILCDIESGRRPLAAGFALPVGMVLWTNVHGGALGGLATILLVLTGWLVWPFRQTMPIYDAKWSPRQIGVIAAGCVLAILINPYGTGLPALWVGLMRSSVLPEVMIEHAPLSLQSSDGVMLFVLGLVYAVVLGRAWPAKRRLTWLIPAVWLFLAISRVRHGPIFAITAVIAVAEMVPFARLGGLATSAEQEVPLNRALPAAWASAAPSGLVITAMVLFSLLLQTARVEVPLVGHHWARPPADYWPVETASVLAGMRGGSNRPLRTFNDMLFGGYLIYHAPGQPVYLDDRCELYGDQALLSYMRACRDPEYFDAIADYDGLNAALVIAHSVLDQHLKSSSSWVRVASDSASSLYIRSRG